MKGKSVIRFVEYGNGMKIGKVFVTLALALFLAGCATCPARNGISGGPKPVKNVIFLLTDGTGPEAWPLARWIKGSPLAVDEILTGGIRTYGADSIITDSAPGATAYATGHKGSDKGISVAPWNITIAAADADPALKYVPLATILEGARLSGRATGLVASANIQHATPAAFSAHWHDRNNYSELGEQQVYQDIDVVLGGGKQYLLPKEQAGGKREDKEDLIAVLKSMGYGFVDTRDQMLAAKSGKLWGAFAPDAMAYDIDRAATAPTEPSLSEMTAKAIDLLTASPKSLKTGFFLFVEGSKIDWAAHANDPSGLTYDLLAFDAAVKIALDFAKKDGSTLVIVVSDHGTGGITIGTKDDKNYSLTDDDDVVVPMRRVKLTGEGIDRLIAGEASEAKIRSIIADNWGITDLSAEEIAAITDSMGKKKALTSILGPMLSRRARLGWTTGGHTGADVFLFSYGPGHPAGLMENTAIGTCMASAMGFDFGSLNRKLFVEAGEAFAALGCQAAIDKRDPANPVILVRKGDAAAIIPLAKNQIRINGKTLSFNGIAVLAEKLEKAYLPEEAVEMTAAELK
jgi:alkaline phosphatase